MNRHITQKALTVLAFARREIGAVGVLLGLAVLTQVFVQIAEEMQEGETSAFDHAVLAALRVPGHPHDPIGPHWLVTMAMDVTALGSLSVLGLILILVAGLFASLRRFRQAAVLLIAAGGGLILSGWLKSWFDRPRPSLVYRVVEAINPSFPSGHAMLSAVAYLTLGALAARFFERRRIKTYVMGAAVFLTLIIGLTRIYLGVHWTTDVIGGWALGAAWAGACWLIEWVWEGGWREGGPAQASGAAPGSEAANSEPGS